MSNSSDKRYSGEEKLIISLDIGCTHSMQYHSKEMPVTRWPGQPEASGDSKVPTISAYKKGKPIAFGAEAREYIGDKDYEIAKWFKLHLHPDEIAKLDDQPPPYNASTNELEIPPLPRGVSLKSVYVEFINYVFEATRLHFEDSTPNGKEIWSRLISSAAVVFAIPNGWDTIQHEFLKEVAVDAGLFQNSDDVEQRIEFVTESEAAVHYVLHETNHATWIHPGTEFAVVDCGGSTIDSTIYRCKATEPKLELEEVAISECVQAGGVYVDGAAQGMLKSKLANSKYGGDDIIADMLDAFEQRTKRLFDGQQESNIITFGSRRDNDRDFGIIQGRLTLGKSEVASTFSFPIEKVLNSCKTLLKTERSIIYCWLAGLANPRIFDGGKEALNSLDVEVYSIEQPAKKAAAEGATVWFIKQYVTAHTARYTIASVIMKSFTPAKEDHWARRQLAFVSAELCTLEASCADMVPELCKGVGDVSYWRLDYDLVLTFTGTRLRARLKWTDKDGKTQYGPVKIVPAKTPSEKDGKAKLKALRKAFARQRIAVPL
ncbi:SubName: Full=Uncharacterized protein {ECO:0000313/EMBL:CCA68622.1} [Serendipita indica DSM 11827]|nr:SubName: Full=Uncharacterized protein {ECO:0000313/EMBL:CCA68622.1} [Serendipita indica DSM 11827]